MGGLWIPEELGWPFVNDFHSRCLALTGITPRHMKWTSVPNRIDGKYFLHYKTLVDLFFEYNTKYNHKVFFKTIIADENYKFDHEIYNNGDSEVGFYKLYYFLILSTLRKGCYYHLRIADRNVSKKKLNIDEADRLHDLQRCLNLGYIKKCNYSFDEHVVLTVEPRPAKKRRLIQLADILMGAIGYQWNGLHLRSNAKKSKVYLANYIADKLGRDNLCFVTPSSNKRINIFRLQL